MNRLKVKEVREWLEIKLRELGKSFDSEANRYFLEVVSRMSNISLGLLDQEINKIGLYNEEKIITKKDLVNVFAGIPEASIFALTDAIGERKLVKALNLLKEQIANGEHFLKILTMLIRSPLRVIILHEPLVSNACEIVSLKRSRAVRSPSRLQAKRR